MFKMSVLGCGIKGLSLSWYTEQGCCQWRSVVHKVCVCSLQGCVHTAVQTAVLLMAYVFLHQWGKEEDNPWSLEEGRGAGSAALEPFFFRRFVSHKEDMPLGREIKGLTVSHWLNFHSKLEKDFKTLRKRLQHCVFFSRHRLWESNCQQCPFGAFIPQRLFAPIFSGFLLSCINEVPNTNFQFSRSNLQVTVKADNKN